MQIKGITVPNRPAIYLCLILIGYTALLLPTVYRQGISWDEQTDIDIARAYLTQPDGWLRGSPSDPSQTRLPMAVVTAVYSLLRTGDLLTARLVSCLVGALTITGVFVFCKRDFDSKTGLLAGAILATSPFFLSFAKTAFTETDIYVACAFVWLLVAMSRLRESGTIGWAAVTAMVLGLALSGKFTAVVLFPAIVFQILSFSNGQTKPIPRLSVRRNMSSRKLWPVSDGSPEFAAGRATAIPGVGGHGLETGPSGKREVDSLQTPKTTGQETGEPERLSKQELRRGTTSQVLMSAAMVLGWLNLSTMGPEGREEALLRFHFLLALGGWIAVLVWAARQRAKVVPPLFLVGFVLVLALGTFMILPPEHLTNPNIIGSLIDRFDREMRWNPAFMVEAAVLHLACVIFKSSPLIGVGLLVSLLATALQWKTKPKARVLLLIVACYFVGLVLLPLAQTFYMIPVLPLLAILAADQWLALMSHRKTVALGLGVLAAIGLCVDLALCYPDFNLNGYQWLGARYLGNRSTIGYRSVVQTTSDGVQQMAQWLNENARPGDRVAAYVYEWHILEAVCADAQLRLTPGQEISVRLRPDYVIVHINHTIRQRWATYFTGQKNARAESVFWEPYDAAWLHTHYTKIATVPRAFGIEMASLWERNDRMEAK